MIGWYAMKDAGKTLLNGVLLFGAVFVTLATGPRVELAIAPPVSLWEIHNPRIVNGQIRWSVLIAQKRRCTPSVQWSTGGVLLTVSGPPLDLSTGEAVEIGQFSAHVPHDGVGPLLSARVIYNCGAPWGLAPINKAERLQVSQ